MQYFEAFMRILLLLINFKLRSGLPWLPRNSQKLSNVAVLRAECLRAECLLTILRGLMSSSEVYLT